MKVISGTLKGRNIKGYNITGTRPTMDRVKESIFSTIQDYIKDSIVLDLFAGSGQLGIEAISNGAKYCYFCDNNKEVTNILKDNLNTFKITNKTKTFLSDYNKVLKDLKENNIKLDLIFIDPPYSYNIINKIVTKILNYELLNEKGLIIIEYQYKFDKIENLTLLKEKKYSNKYVNIYKKD